MHSERWSIRKKCGRIVVFRPMFTCTIINCYSGWHQHHDTASRCEECGISMPNAKEKESQHIGVWIECEWFTYTNESISTQIQYYALPNARPWDSSPRQCRLSYTVLSSLTHTPRTHTISSRLSLSLFAMLFAFGLKHIAP